MIFAPGLLCIDFRVLAGLLPSTSRCGGKKSRLSSLPDDSLSSTCVILGDTLGIIQSSCLFSHLTSGYPRSLNSSRLDRSGTIVQLTGKASVNESIQKPAFQPPAEISTPANSSGLLVLAPLSLLRVGAIDGFFSFALVSFRRYFSF